mmetsp:Transcript_26452/g.56826  ORF Transcript_26452/g.56826 Transcript_26452/m.56826 type:complete len:213 (+) Transcript_26452:3170-3808(+)
MFQWQFDEFPHGRQMRRRSADGVVPGVGEVVGIVTVDGLALAFDQRIINNNTCRVTVHLHTVNFDALEFNQPLGTINAERITTMKGTEFALKVRLQIRLEQFVRLLLDRKIDARLLDGISVGQDQHRLAKLDVGSGHHGHAVSRTHPGIFHGVVRHANGTVIRPIVRHFGNAGVQCRNVRVGNHGHGCHCLASALSLDGNGVAVEDSEVFHG